MKSVQIAKEIFLFTLSVMKSILSLLEFRLEKDSEAYKYAKQQVMFFFYNGLKDLFKKLEKQDIVEQCECNSNFRKGYSKCDMCAGSGYRNPLESPSE